MPLLTNSIKSAFVNEFFQSLTDPRSDEKYYVFYGGIKERENENVVPEPVDTLQEENEAKRNTIFYNHILPSDVSLMVRRYDWTTGTVYDQYEDDVDLSDKKYYVLVGEDLPGSDDDYKVYMCLSNNGGVPSVYAPEGTNTQEIKTADGYVWKYMYSFTEQMDPFLTQNYMPIVKIDGISYSDERALSLDVKLDAVYGFIEKITIDSASPTYTDLVNPNLNSTHTVSTVTGLTFTVNLLSDLSTTNNYYNNNYIVYFDSGKVGTVKTYTVSGNTATIELCEIYPDNNTGAGNINTGDRYSILPKVNIVGNGYGAVAVPVFTNNLLTDIEIINGGEGYNFAFAYVLTGGQVNVSVVVPPDGGYGYDIINELKPRHVLIRKEFKYSQIEEGKEKFFGLGSQIRQYGLIKNIKTDLDYVIPNTYQSFDVSLVVDSDAQINGVDYYFDGQFDFNINTLTTECTHILGADTFSSGKVESLTVNPQDPKLINLVLSEVVGDFERARINSTGNVTLGERIVFVKKTSSGISNDFSVLYAPKSVYCLSQSFVPVNTTLSLRSSVVQKLKLTRTSSSIFNDTVIPIGSYLYREATETTDSASAYVLSLGTKQTVGSDIEGYVYVVAEKGNFSQGDDISCVIDPFVQTVELFSASCAGNTGVSVSVSEAGTSSDDVNVNKYSGNVLYIQNIEPLTLASNTIFTTRILLGF